MPSPTSVSASLNCLGLAGVNCPAINLGTVLVQELDPVEAGFEGFAQQFRPDVPFAAFRRLHEQSGGAGSKIFPHRTPFIGGKRVIITQAIGAHPERRDALRPGFLIHKVQIEQGVKPPGKAPGRTGVASARPQSETEVTWIRSSTGERICTNSRRMAWVSGV